MLSSRLPIRLAAWSLGAMVAAASARAAPSLPLNAPGYLTVDERGSSAEIVRLPANLATELLAAGRDVPLVVEGWPIAPGERAPVALRRMDVYAPDAHVYAVGDDGLHEVPRSPNVYLHGAVAGDDGADVLVIDDVRTGEVRSLVRRGDQLLEMVPTARGGRHLLHVLDPLRRDGQQLSWRCAEEATDLDRLLAPTTPPRARLSTADPSSIVKKLSLLHTATIAIDTDHQFMSAKFSNNTASATTYIANLFATMNVIYQRDLDIQLVQQIVFLRTSVAADPYLLPCDTVSFPGFCLATGAQLNEVAIWWTTAAPAGCGATCSSINRAAVMMLSGKSLGGSASGIAFVNALCSTGIGYSFNEVFSSAGDTSFSDTLITGHELGHNFGSLHTHCYNPPIDDCYNSESGCYSGPKSCPAPATYNGVTNVTGTLMSYCHLSGIGGCTSSYVFHPRTVDLLDSILETKVGQCINLPAGSFEDGFEGYQGAFPLPWSGKHG